MKKLLVLATCMMFSVALMLSVFVGNGQAAVIYANNVDSFSGVTSSGNLTGVQDLHYANFSNGGSAILSFAQNFVDVTGGDAKIYIESWDLFSISGITVRAQKVSDDKWVTLSSIRGVNAQIVGWWFDWTKGYEIPGAGSNQYDHIMLSYSGACSIDVDAISVNTGSAAAPVPEPGTMLLLGSGLIGLASFGRKKFRK